MNWSSINEIENMPKFIIMYKDVITEYNLLINPEVCMPLSMGEADLENVCPS